MPTIQIETDQLLKTALQMPEEELKQFVAKLFALIAVFYWVRPRPRGQMREDAGLPARGRTRLKTAIRLEKKCQFAQG